MTCDDAVNLISSRIDGEIGGEDDAALDAHLAECEACRRTLADTESQDAALMRGFLPRQRIAAEIAARVVQTMDSGAMNVRSADHRAFGIHLWSLAALAAAVTVGFGVAVAVLRPKPTQVFVPMPISTASFEPIARLSLASGDVFTCPASEKSWRHMTSNEAIGSGAKVRTADAAKCELQLADGSCVRLNSGTEAAFPGDHAVCVSKGEVWSSVAAGARPFRVSAGNTSVSARGSRTDPLPQFALTCVEESATVSVQRGSADVCGRGERITVSAGQVFQPSGNLGAYACRPVSDPVAVTRWQDALLVLKPADNPELVSRFNQLITRMAEDRIVSAVPGAAERDLRALGPAWCPSLARFVRAYPKTGDRRSRLIAAQILGDLAAPENIPDLIALLDDDDGDTRFASATALKRLTGQTLGFPPDHCAATRDTAAVAAWRAWAKNE